MRNKKLCQEVLDQLASWREGFMADGFEWEKSIGVECITDQLDNIQGYGHPCYASYLFSKLSEEDKEFIKNQLGPEYVEISFDGLYIVYSLD